MRCWKDVFPCSCLSPQPSLTLRTASLLSLMPSALVAAASLTWKGAEAPEISLQTRKCQEFPPSSRSVYSGRRVAASPDGTGRRQPEAFPRRCLWQGPAQLCAGDALCASVREGRASKLLPKVQHKSEEGSGRWQKLTSPPGLV